jgi:hypothetical protein
MFNHDRSVKDRLSECPAPCDEPSLKMLKNGKNKMDKRKKKELEFNGCRNY